MNARAPDPATSGLPVWAVGDGAPPARAHLAVVPGTLAPLIALSLPETLRGPARMQVARRQVQDRLGLSDAMLWPLDTGPAWTRAVVASVRDAAAWRKAVGGRCRALLPDYLTLPHAPGLWVVSCQGGVLSARLGAEDGFTAELDLGVEMLARTTPRPRAILLLGAAEVPGLDAAGSVFTSLSDLPDDLRPAPASWPPQGPVMGVDLARDGASDPVAPLARKIRLAVIPAVMAVTGAALFTAATLTQIRSDQTQAQALRDAVEQAARRDILPAGPIIDLQAQVLRAVDQRRDPRGPDDEIPPVHLLARASGVLAGLDIEQLALSQDAPFLSITVRARDFASLESVVEALNGAGLRARSERSATGQGGGVQAQILIDGATPLGDDEPLAPGVTGTTTGATP